MISGVSGPNRIAHQYGISESQKIRNLASNTSLSTQESSIILIRLSRCMCACGSLLFTQEIRNISHGLIYVTFFKVIVFKIKAIYDLLNYV